MYGFYLWPLAIVLDLKYGRMMVVREAYFLGPKHLGCLDNYMII